MTNLVRHTMKALFIAEKPSVARDVQRVYNKMNHPDQIDFTAFVGHVCGLSMPEDYEESWGKPWRPDVLPMIPSKFKITVKDNVKDVYSQVSDKIKNGNYDYVICGTDAGREGELIFKLFYDKSNCKLPVKRFWASDTTDATVEKALLNLIDDKTEQMQNLEKSARYRAYFDWLLGLNLTRAVTLQSKTHIPVGRVMTPTLSILVNRELAIRNFKPEAFWEIEGVFNGYSGTWIHSETKERRLTKEDEAKAILAKVNGAKEGVVAELETKRQKTKAPALHNLIELQKEGSKLFGYTASEVLDIAQALYEKHKLLSYPRTESRFLPKAVGALISKHIEPLRHVPELASYANSILGNPSLIKEVMGRKEYVDDSKVTDHHGLLITNTVPNLSILSERELNIYMLVARRVISLFMPAMEIDVTTMITKVNGENFISKGQMLIEEGFMVLYPKKSKGKGKDDEDKMLPKLAKGDAVPVKEIKVLTKETTPPKRYDEAGLLSAMENAGSFLEESELKSIMKETKGLGTSATRAAIIEKLINVKMIERQKKSVFPTEFGMSVIAQLGERDIVSPSLTAVWETKLRDIEQGTYSPEKFYAEMLDYIKKNTAEVLNSMKPMDKSVTPSSSGNKVEKEVLGACPKCGSNVIEGKDYYLCEKYKNPCTFISGKTYFKAKITKADMKAMLKGKLTKPKTLTYASGKTSESELKISKDGKVVASWMDK